jgi:cytochrome c oxidase subunit 2
MKRNKTLLAIILPGMLFLAGCSGSPSFLNPNSYTSAVEANLFAIIFYMALAVFLLVEVLLIYNVVRFRKRSKQPVEPGGDPGGEPRQKYGNVRLEVIWTLIPVLLVLSLFLMTVKTMGMVSNRPPSASDVNVTVIGHQWWWEFDYPDQGIETANELHVPVGANVQLTLESVDVIHSFWVPQLAHKVDAIPRQVNHLWFKADKPGVFYGQCAEFCGVQHANMIVKVVVDSESEYAAWVTAQQQPAVQPTTDLEKQGQDLVIKGICGTCHSLGDHKAPNPIGPNLTHLMSRSVIAGGMYENTMENMYPWLQNTQAMKPGNHMVVNIPEKDMAALLAFISILK